MNKKISNSMSTENDPVFDVITPLCAVCLNSGVGDICKAKGKKLTECKYGQSYKCDDFLPNKNNFFYKIIKDKIQRR